MIRKYYGSPINYTYYNEYLKWPAPIRIEDYKEYNKILNFAKKHCIKCELTKNGHLPKMPLGNKWIVVNKQKDIIIYDNKVYFFHFWPGYIEEQEEVHGADCLKYMIKNGHPWIDQFLVKDNSEIIKFKEEHKDELRIFITITPKAEINKTYYSFFDDIIVHFDLNSAYPAAVKEAIPESAAYWDNLYELKQQGDELAKKRLNYPIGASYSLNIRGYRCPMIRYYAVTGCNRHLINLASVVNIFGKVLLFNTDGFWAILNRKDINKIVAMANQRGETFGEGLGQWKIDHNVDKFRIKSRGAYEYVEEGKYHPVIRGRSVLDRIKPREDWQWGDIYQREYGYKRIDDRMEEVYDEETQKENVI